MFFFQIVFNFLKTTVAPGQTFDSSGWLLQTAVGDNPKEPQITLQENGVDCGAFVCTYVHLISRKLSCLFVGSMMEVRKSIFEAIVSGCLQDLPLRQVSQGDAKERKTNITGLYLVQSGTICQDNPVLFGETNNKQCTAIATYSVPALCEWTPPFTEEHLDKIVRNGDLYYRECRKFSSDIYLDCDDLLETLPFDGGIVELSIVDCTYGTFDQVDYLTESVTAAMGLGSTLGRCGFLFMGHLRTLSFVPLSERKSWVFNSHCVDVDNRTCIGSRNRKQGRARLFKAYNIDALVSALLADHPRDGARWLIAMIQFDRKDPYEHSSTWA